MAQQSSDNAFVSGNETTAVCHSGAQRSRATAARHIRDYPALLPIDRRHYTIVDEIARGGMGRVLRARDRRLGRDVAIKELLVHTPELVRRFEREARLTARLQHPAIVNVLEAGVSVGGGPLMVMPLISGRSLSKILAAPLTPAQRLALVPHVQVVAEAAAHAHEHHVVHRDIKPSNVLIGHHGETFLVDWGLAKELAGSSSQPARGDWHEDPTAIGAVMGTPGYMAPEQARGEHVDTRADVYALGALLYHVVAGKPAFAGGDSLEGKMCGRPRPLRELAPRASRALLAVVDKAMHPDPAARHKDARQFADELARIRAGGTRRPYCSAKSRSFTLLVFVVAAVLVSSLASTLEPSWWGLFAS